MIHRLAISVGTIAAAAVLAIGFAASGLGPAAAPADAGQVPLAEPQAMADPVTEDPTAKPITRVETTTIYVKPPPKRKVIRVTRRDPAPAAKRHAVKPTRANRERQARHRDREDDDDREDREDDDDREDREDRHEEEDD